MTNVYCPRCQTLKTREDFHKSNTRRGVQSRCKLCQKQQLIDRRLKSPEVFRTYKNKSDARQAGTQKLKDQRKNWALKSAYGITLEDYGAMLEKQNGCCAICGSSDTGSKHSHFHVDHSHDTDKVRALLCAGCNIGLGAFKENIDALQNAVAYLKLHNNNNKEIE